jgi:hypothetical protein
MPGLISYLQKLSHQTGPAESQKAGKAGEHIQKVANYPNTFIRKKNVESIGVVKNITDDT